MIVRIEVHHHTSPPYWQLKRCQVQVEGLMQDVSDPALLRPIRFGTLEESIRHAKRATFAFLEKGRQTELPDQMEWRIHEDDQIFPCPACHQPLYRKAKLGRFGNTLDLQDWGCVRCKKTVTFNSEGLLSTASARPRSISPPLPPSQGRVISLPSTPWNSAISNDAPPKASVSPVEMVISCSIFATKMDRLEADAPARLFPVLFHCRAFRAAR